MSEIIVDRSIESDMKESYLDYAMSVIIGRAIPDVRDGLKPVHRRILYSMWQTGLHSSARFKKCASVVGDVLAKYHPHGDTAVYDSLVRMAQAFSLRYVLVHGQGNFGCFTKDTKVRLADGRNLSFEDLIKEDTEGKRNFTFSVDKEGKIKIAEIKNPRLTIKNAKIMKVVLDNGQEIKCTLNHKFMLKDGTYTEAEYLKAGDSLMPLYTRHSTKQEDPNIAGYEMVLQPNLNTWTYAHHLADQWNLENGIYLRSAGKVRHHKDFNKLNNSPTNILRMQWKDHWKLHYELSSQRHKTDEQYREKLAQGRKDYWKKPENIQKISQRISNKNKENWQKVEYRESMSQKLSEINKKYIANHPEKRQELSIRATKTLKRLWQNAEYRQFIKAKIIKGNKNHTTNKTGKLKFVKICKHILEKGESLSEEIYEKNRLVVYPYGHATSWKTALNKYFQNNPDLILQELNNNHKVLHTEILNQSEDVYDITIDETHNFALAAGVFVHNSIDGDNAAAYRYTESKLKSMADEMLLDLDKETVEMVQNFDGSVDEPVVLPSKLPMVLLNGSSGIAVGMATNIPPHNLGEISDALTALIDGADEEKLLQLVSGPDFPTGGIIVGRAGIIQAYKTGRGSLKMRARAEKDEKRNAIVVTEIPYQVTKTSIIESIVEAVKNKKIEGISGVHDRSDKDGMEIVIDIKKGHDMDVVLNQLYAHTGLQSSFGIINLAIVGKQPKVMGLKEILTEFIKFRQEIVRNRCTFELKKAHERAHILEGLRIALLNIDPIVNFLKASKDLVDARVGLISRYALSEIQANAILEMRLSRLVALEREKIETEHNELIIQIKHLKEILADEQKILHIIKEEITQIKQKYADPRRTEILEGEDDEKDIESLIPNDEVVVMISGRGYVKRVSLEEYRTQNRGGKGVIGTTKEEDFINDVVVTKNHNYLLLFTDKGRMFWLKVYKIPESTRYATGKTLVSMLDLKDEKVTSWISVEEFTNSEYLSMVTKNGIIKRTSLDSYSNVRKGGIIAINLREGDALVEVLKTNGNEELLIATKNGQAIRFKEDDAREVGRNSIGVIGIRFKENDNGTMDDEVIGMTTCKKPAILTITENGFGKRTAIEEYRLQGRGGSGIINIIVEGRNGPVVGVKSVDETDEIIVMSSKGQAIRTSMKDIRIIGRNTQGVRIIRLADGETVATFAVVVKNNQETDSNVEMASN